MSVGPYGSGNGGKAKVKAGPSRLGQRRGRSGRLSRLLLLLLEGYTQRVVSSYGLDKGASHDMAGINEGCAHWVAPSFKEEHQRTHHISQQMSVANEGCRWWERLEPYRLNLEILR